ncbi:MAG: hypothetical protein IJM30_07330 [Thermoguttaceae bacterium]|nr:hypothetical protein [Thermoguttaceae bacterium]
MKLTRLFFILIASIATSVAFARGADPTPQTSSATQTEKSDWEPKDPAKASVLFVLETPAEGEPHRAQCAEIARRKIESFATALKKSAPGQIKVSALFGDQTTAKDICAACKAYSDELGPNDALFVYVFAPSVSLANNGRVYNGIAPRAPSSLNPEPEKHGVLRRTIRKHMSTRAHRLEVLLVDVCPSFALSTRRALLDEGPAEEVSTDFSYFARFLLEGEGFLDLSSSRPNRAEALDEPVAWIPLEAQAKETATPELFAKLASDRLSGTLFLNAFLDAASDARFTDADLTPDGFAVALESSMKEREKRFREVFFGERFQTLTRFDRRAAEIVLKKDRSEQPQAPAQ